MNPQNPDIYGRNIRGPNLHGKAKQLAAALPPLLVAAERVAATVSQGVHGRRRVGQGETFWQFRRYQAGDCRQSIDWRQSAKSSLVYVRENEWEAAQSVWMWRDCSPSMNYRSSKKLPRKVSRASLLLLGLTSLLVRGGERVALLGSGIAPAPGRPALRRMAATVEAEIPGLGDIPDSANLPGVEPLPRYGCVVLIGDFLAPMEDTGKLIDYFTARGLRGHMLKVMDPAEETLPFSGRVLFEGMENEAEIIVPRVEAVRDKYRAGVEAHNRGLASMAGRVGWTFAVHRTDHPPETALMALFQALSRPF